MGLQKKFRSRTKRINQAQEQIEEHSQKLFDEIAKRRKEKARASRITNILCFVIGALLSILVSLLTGCTPSEEVSSCDPEKESCTYCLNGRAIVTIHPDGSFIGKDCECVEPFEGFGECVK